MVDPSTIVSELADRLEMDRRSIWALCRCFEALGVDVVNGCSPFWPSAGVSPLQRVGVVRLACCEPAGIGLHMTHWSTRSLARAAQLRGIAPTISHSEVALILRDADLRPHRSRYWKTPIPDDTFRSKAAQIIWCYERAQALAEQGEVVLCLDEKPNIQVLERRCPSYRVRPGLIEKREFEYKRHGTVSGCTSGRASSAHCPSRRWARQSNT